MTSVFPLGCSAGSRFSGICFFLDFNGLYRTFSESSFFVKNEVDILYFRRYNNAYISFFYPPYKPSGADA